MKATHERSEEVWEFLPLEFPKVLIIGVYTKIYLQAHVCTSLIMTHNKTGIWISDRQGYNLCRPDYKTFWNWLECNFQKVWILIIMFTAISSVPGT